MYHEMLSYHRWTAQLVMSVDIFSTAAQLYEKKHIRNGLLYVNDLEGHSRSSEWRDLIGHISRHINGRYP